MKKYFYLAFCFTVIVRSAYAMVPQDKDKLRHQSTSVEVNVGLNLPKEVRDFCADKDTDDSKYRNAVASSSALLPGLTKSIVPSRIKSRGLLNLLFKQDASHQDDNRDCACRFYDSISDYVRYNEIDYAYSNQLCIVYCNIKTVSDIRKKDNRHPFSLRKLAAPASEVFSAFGLLHKNSFILRRSNPEIVNAANADKLKLTKILSELPVYRFVLPKQQSLMSACRLTKALHNILTKQLNAERLSHEDLRFYLQNRQTEDELQLPLHRFTLQADDVFRQVCLVPFQSGKQLYVTQLYRGMASYFVVAQDKSDEWKVCIQKSDGSYVELPVSHETLKDMIVNHGSYKFLALPVDTTEYFELCTDKSRIQYQWLFAQRSKESDRVSIPLLKPRLMQDKSTELTEYDNRMQRAVENYLKGIDSDHEDRVCTNKGNELLNIFFVKARGEGNALETIFEYITSEKISYTVHRQLCILRIDYPNGSCFFPCEKSNHNISTYDKSKKKTKYKLFVRTIWDRATCITSDIRLSYLNNAWSNVLFKQLNHQTLTTEDLQHGLHFFPEQDALSLPLYHFVLPDDDALYREVCFVPFQFLNPYKAAKLSNGYASYFIVLRDKFGQWKIHDRGDNGSIDERQVSHSELLLLIDHKRGYNHLMLPVDTNEYFILLNTTPIQYQ